MTNQNHIVSVDPGLGFSAYTTNDDHIHIYQALECGHEIEIRLNRIEARELCRCFPALIAELEATSQ